MRVNVRFVLGAFVSCCFACGCVLKLVVCRVRFARVSCPRLRFRGTLCVDRGCVESTDPFANSLGRLRKHGRGVE